jgi:hypothetical protein
MAFDTTVGGASANSYGTVSDADNYFADRSITAWTGTDAAKQAALIKATDYLDHQFDFIGTKATSAQALEWPRINVTDRNGYAVSSTAIPVFIRNACFEAALQAIKGTNLQPVDTTGISESRVKAGPVETEKKFVGGGSSRTVIRSVQGLLSDFITSNSNSVEMLRS